MGVHENIIAEQEERGIVPPIDRQHSKYLTCGTCGEQIKKATVTNKKGVEVQMWYSEPNEGVWENGVLAYHHKSCIEKPE